MIPIVIPPSQASGMDVHQLKEYIKKNPSVLEKKHDEEKEKEPKRHEKKHKLYYYEESDDEESESDKHDEHEKSEDDKYVSKKEIDIEKLEDKVRYLKLDLNNEQLKVTDLEEALSKETALRSRYEKMIQYTNDSINFIQYKPFTSVPFNYDYNTEMIQTTKRFNEIETIYKKLLKWKHELDDNQNNQNNNDHKILDHFDREIRLKFDELQQSYQRSTQSLLSFAKKMSTMKYVILFLFLSNLFLLFK